MRYIDDYVKDVKRTLPKGALLQDNLMQSSLGLAGETGEVIELIKKAMYQGHELDRESMIEELGDTLFYMFALMDSLKITLEEVIYYNIGKRGKRYPNGFDTEKSVNREV